MTLNIRGNKTLAFFNSLFSSIAAPMQSSVQNSISSVDNIWSNYFSLVNVKEENQILKKQIGTLKEENSIYIEENLKLKRILKLSDFNTKVAKESVLADVVGFDPTTWSKIVFIRSRETETFKIGKKMAVVSHEGLVGQIVEVSKNTASALLITDIRSSVDVLIQRTRARGVLVGLNKDYGKIKYVPINEDVKIGDRVISTGLGGIFPKGLLVGTVLNIKKEKFGLFQQIELKPSADLSRLEDILVITEG